MLTSIARRMISSRPMRGSSFPSVCVEGKVSRSVEVCDGKTWKNHPLHLYSCPMLASTAWWRSEDILLASNQSPDLPSIKKIKRVEGERKRGKRNSIVFPFFPLFHFDDVKLFRCASSSRSISPLSLFFLLSSYEANHISANMRNLLQPSCSDRSCISRGTSLPPRRRRRGSSSAGEEVESSRMFSQHATWVRGVQSIDK